MSWSARQRARQLRAWPRVRSPKSCYARSESRCAPVSSPWARRELTTALRAVNRSAEAQMSAAVDAAREAGETLGGVICVAAHSVPIGLGSYVQWTEKLDGRIAQAIMSVHAVKALALGDAVAAARRVGS